MILASLISGGKDSVFATYKMIKEGHKVKYLLSMFPESKVSYMFHHPNVNLTELQAEAMGIPLITGKTKGVKEEELKDLKNLIAKVKDGAEGLITGALASNYQKERIDSICKELGIKSIAPLWHIDPKEYWNILLKNDFRIIITAVAAEGLDEKWLGRVIDKDALSELIKLSEKYRFHLGFEGGEAETLVLDCPLFSRKIEVIDAEKSFKGGTGTYIIKKARLASKI